MSETNGARPLREEQRPARQEVEEVTPGVLRIQLPISLPGLGHVNCYAMEDSRGVTLVDPGLPGLRTWRHLKNQLKTVDLSVDQVHTVVVTHSHPDHFGQVGRFRKAGAEIVTHRSFRTFLDPEAEADDEEMVTVVDDSAPATSTTAVPHSHGPTCSHQHEPSGPQGPNRPATPFPAVTPWGGKPYELPISRRIRYKAMRMAAGRIFSTPRPTKRVDDADVLELGGREWVSVHTPGHTEDHLCLWDPNSGVMITGDHVLPTITPHISGLTDSVDPLSQFFESLELMSTFDGVTAVLPAHGLVFDDLSGRANAISRHHEDRLLELRQAGEKVGDGTVEDYMKQLFRERSWGPMAESETYAHLQHLRLRNQAETKHDGAQLRYTMKD
jgi:glyoxylase-like metal-dependent hydrolase (beta-lactamase superfamily II)